MLIFKVIYQIFIGSARTKTYNVSINIELEPKVID